MKIARARLGQENRWLIVEDGAVFTFNGDFADPRKGQRLRLNPDELDLLAPVEATNKIVLLLGNWAGRGDRDGPAFILKPSSAIINPGDDIVYPRMAERVHAEPELGIVIGSACRHVSPAEAERHILGFTVANDATMFEMSLKTSPMPFLVGKCVDTFAGLGPWIVTGIDGDHLEVTAHHDGEQYLRVNTADMAWSTREIVSWVSMFMTLHPGDVICCGAPVGFDLRWLLPGSRVRIAIEHIGELESAVVEDRQQ